MSPEKTTFRKQVIPLKDTVLSLHLSTNRITKWVRAQFKPMSSQNYLGDVRSRVAEFLNFGNL